VAGWAVERIVHFGPEEFTKSGLAHFGFHLRDGQYCAIVHQQHYLGLVQDGRLLWTAASGRCPTVSGRERSRRT